MADGARLDEFDKDEFRIATRALWPVHWTEDDFDAAWREFIALKRRKTVERYAMRASGLMIQSLSPQDGD